MIANVVVDVKNMQVNRSFDYIIPAFLEDVLEVGYRVVVPFGNRKVMGFIVGIKENSEFKSKLKEIEEVVDLYKPLNQEFVDLAYDMAKNNFSFYISCLETMLPTALKVKYKKVLVLKSNKVDDNIKALFDKNNRLVITKDNVKYLRDIKEYIASDMIGIEDYVDVNGKTKTIKMVTVSDETYIPNSKKGQDLLAYLLEINEDISLSDIINELGYSRAVVNTLVKNNCLSLYDQEVYRNPEYKMKIENKKVNLNIEQQNAVTKISASFNKPKTFVLHGITGSGKTEVYLDLIDKVISHGKDAIMLVPEIGLTPQMVSRFKGRFKDNVAVLHSRLSIGEKYDEWRKILMHKAHIVVGARSAIFAPLANIGIIIIDECHEDSYIQFDTNPKYSAIEVAMYRSKYHNCPLVLGSATPKITDYYKALSGEYELIKLNNRPNKTKLPSVSIVDLREELKHGNKSVFSKELEKKVKETYAKGEQGILFLNRRGFSSIVMCRSCGEEVKCPHCDVALTYHKYNNILKCHYCGYEMPNVSECPKCKSKLIRYVGTGTQKIEEELKNILPDARILRMDVDTTRSKHAYEEIFETFKNNDADFLIGTQMIAKGLDFENVTLVGVMNADIGLKYPVYDAYEKTYSLLEQVSGRAGRSSKEGTVIIQTYSPDNYAIKCAELHSYDTFYDIEIKNRKMASNPPFSQLVLIEVKSRDPNNAYAHAKRIIAYLEPSAPNILGPTEASIFKQNDLFTFQIYVRIEQEEALMRIFEINQMYQNEKDTYVNINRM